MMKMLAAVMVAAAGFATVAQAASPLPRLTVDKAFRQAELARSAAFKAARVTCTWSAGTVNYSCVTWTPSASSTGTVVAGVNAKVYARRGIQACAKAGSQGCTVTTSKPSCVYALGTYSASGSSASYRIVNVCRTGWAKLLR